MKIWRLREKFKSLEFERLHLIYVFGFFVNFRPIDPFNHEYFTTEKNFTDRQVNADLYPLAFYSSAIALLVVFCFLDLCCYNPFIALYAISGAISTGLVSFCGDLFQLQVAQVLHGISLANEVAYFIYLYPFMDSAKKYKMCTSYLRAAILAGKLVSFLISQLLVSQNWATFKQLNHASFAFSILALSFLPFLPIYRDNTYWKKSEKSGTSPGSWILSTIRLLYANFVNCFSDKYVIKWSLWTSFSLCGYLQVQTFVQPLWKLSQVARDVPAHNGAVEGVLALLALFITVLMGLGQLDWKYKGDLILTVASLLHGFLLIFASQFESVVLQYLFYVLFGIVYHGAVTALWGELAQKLDKGCYGLVFGFAFFLGSILNCVMVGLLVDNTGFELNTYDQFLVYGAYHVAVAILFIVFGLVSWLTKHTYGI